MFVNNISLKNFKKNILKNNYEIENVYIWNYLILSVYYMGYIEKFNILDIIIKY